MKIYEMLHRRELLTATLTDAFSGSRFSRGRAIVTICGGLLPSIGEGTQPRSGDLKIVLRLIEAA